MSKIFRCPIEVECQGEPLSEADVAAWEARNGWVFPEDYRRFLLAHNGGLVRPNVFRTRSGEEAMWERPNDLSRHYESLFDAPEGFVSIGDDLGGNHTFLCLKGYRYGRIYCSDHESGCIQVPFLRRTGGSQPERTGRDSALPPRQGS